MQDALEDLSLRQLLASRLADLDPDLADLARSPAALHEERLDFFAELAPDSLEESESFQRFRSLYRKRAKAALVSDLSEDARIALAQAEEREMPPDLLK